MPQRLCLENRPHSRLEPEEPVVKLPTRAVEGSRDAPLDPAFKILQRGAHRLVVDLPPVAAKQRGLPHDLPDRSVVEPGEVIERGLYLRRHVHAQSVFMIMES